MISLDHKAFFWEKFDEHDNPINPKECHIIFDPKVGGELRYLLNLNEQFEDNNCDKRIKKLYGHAKDGKAFTLLNINFIEPALRQCSKVLELTELRYSIEYIFYDGWVKEDKLFDVVHVRYSYLELWLNQIEIKRPLHNKDKIMAGVMVNKEHLSCSTKYNNIIFSIENVLNQNTFNNKSATYENTNYLAMAKKGKFKIDEAVEIANVVKSFFEIITFYSKNKIFVEEFYIVNKIKLEDAYPTEEIVDILFKQDDYIEEQKMFHIDFLFIYTDIKDDFVQILNNWVENHDKNQNEYSAFCKVIADKNTKFNIYSHYFQLISALEGYHTRNTAEDLEFRKRLNLLIKQSDIKEILDLNSKTHKSIANCIYDIRNDIAHSKKL